MGSMVSSKWAASHRVLYVTELVLIAGCGRHTDWAIGLGEAQRFSIMSDAKFKGGDYNPRIRPAPGCDLWSMMASCSYIARRRLWTSGSAAGLCSATVCFENPPRTRTSDSPRTRTRARARRCRISRWRVTCSTRGKVHPAVRRQLLHPAHEHAGLARRGARARRSTRRCSGGSRIEPWSSASRSDVLYPFHLQTELADRLPNAEMYAIDDVARTRRVPHRDQTTQRRDRAFQAPDSARTRTPSASPPPPPPPWRPSWAAPRTASENPSEQTRSIRANSEARFAPRVGALPVQREGGEEARRADALLAEVARLKDEAAARDAGGGWDRRAGKARDGAVVSWEYGLRARRRTRRPTEGFSRCTGRFARRGGTDAPSRRSAHSSRRWDGDERCDERIARRRPRARDAKSGVPKDPNVVARAAFRAETCDVAERM